MSRLLLSREWSDVAVVATSPRQFVRYRVEFLNANSGADRTARIRFTRDGATVWAGIEVPVPLFPAPRSEVVGGFWVTPAPEANRWVLQAMCAAALSVYVESAEVSS